MNNYDHLDEQTKAVINLSNEERINYMHKPVWINYSKTKKLIQIMNQLMNYPKKPRMTNLLIVGEPNMGKTTVIRKFSQMHPDVTHEDEDGMSKAHKPVILALAPTTVDEKHIYISILEQFWTPFRPNDTTAKLRHQMLYLMRECNVRMLIIDEIHNILETSTIKQRIAMNVLKNLSNELMMPIVGVGTDVAVKILSNDPQHASRFQIARLSKLEENKELRGILHAFEKKLPLKKPSKIYQKEKGKLLYNICDGNLGNLHKLLIECATYAIENEIEEITVDIIKQFRWVRPTKKDSPMEIPL